MAWMMGTLYVHLLSYLKQRQTCWWCRKLVDFCAVAGHVSEVVHAQFLSVTLVPRTKGAQGAHQAEPYFFSEVRLS